MVVFGAIEKSWRAVPCHTSSTVSYHPRLGWLHTEKAPHITTPSRCETLPRFLAQSGAGRKCLSVKALRLRKSSNGSSHRIGATKLFPGSGEADPVWLDGKLIALLKELLIPHLLSLARGSDSFLERSDSLENHIQI
jgi:hypothetical protein